MTLFSTILTSKGHSSSSLRSLGHLLRFSFIFKWSVKAVKVLMEHSLLTFWPFFFHLLPIYQTLSHQNGSIMQVVCVFLSASSSSECITQFINASYLSILMYLIFYLMKFLTYRLRKLFKRSHPSYRKSAH